MPKQLDVTVSIPLNAGAVRTRLQDPRMVEHVAMAAGASSAKVSTDGDATIVERELEVPASARAMLKGNTVHTTERRVWGLSGAEISVTVQGVEAGFKGWLELRESGEYCAATLSGVVEARLGFASAIAESVLRDRLTDTFRAECEAVA